MDYKRIIKEFDLDVTGILGSIINANFSYVVVLKDIDSRIVFVNNRFYVKHTEFITDPMSVIGKNDFDLFGDSDHARQALADEQSVIKTGKALNIIEVEGRDHEGNPVVAHTRKYPMYNNSGEIVGLLVITEDLTSDLLVLMENKKRTDRLSEMNHELSIQNLKDALSGLYNRKFIRSKLDELYDLKLNENIPFSIILLDVDHFKEINDSYGHTVGDEVITFIGNSLKDIRKHSSCEIYPCRFGGDEFLIICEADKEETVDLANNVHQYFKEHCINATEAEFSQCISVSVGVATIKEEETVHELLNRCDQNLYVSKRAGRDRVTF